MAPQFDDTREASNPIVTILLILVILAIVAWGCTDNGFISLPSFFAPLFPTLCSTSSDAKVCPHDLKKDTEFPSGVAKGTCVEMGIKMRQSGKHCDVIMKKLQECPYCSMCTKKEHICGDA